jgi:Nucleoside recognition
MFGGLTEGYNVPFAISVLPIIIFLGALIGLLYYLRVIQWFVEIVGGAISWLLRTSKVESVWAATAIFLGQAEAPLLIAPYLRRLTRSELFTCMSRGFASVAGSTLVARPHRNGRIEDHKKHRRGAVEQPQAQKCVSAVPNTQAKADPIQPRMLCSAVTLAYLPQVHLVPTHSGHSGTEVASDV